MIFQEPMTSLNPVYTIGNQISEMFMLHEMMISRRTAGLLCGGPVKGGQTDGF
jgi:ABC-type microcin C transport system duplicated ATPase subunit YejF